jgi:hypothetical protein
VNNPDRIPSMSDKQGNSHNLIFEVKNDDKIDETTFRDPLYADLNFSDTVAIDNKCYCIA